MIKTIPLILASLKGFMRNWKSIVLLIVFPLILISVVFLSFNTEGLQKVPVGIGSTADFDIAELRSTVSSFLTITEFGELDRCLSSLKAYEQYVCIEVVHEQAFILDVHYDNTREPVIWEILARIKNTVDLLQKQKSKEIAAGAVTTFRGIRLKVEELKKSLATIDGQLQGYIDETDYATIQLKDAKVSLSNTLVSMNRDIEEVKSSKRDLEAKKGLFYSASMQYADNIDNSASIINLAFGQNQTSSENIRNYAAGLKTTIHDYDYTANRYLEEIDEKIGKYEDSSRRGDAFAQDMDEGVEKLKELKQDLLGYKAKLKQASDEIAAVESQLAALSSLDAEVLVNPIVIRNNPAYIPEISKELLEEYMNEPGSTVEKIIKGIGLISLQTIFPSVLLLIILFLSLLISSFICLSEINSSANTRIKLVKGILLHEFFSTYLSSLIILVLPVLCVLALGHILFKIAIFSNIMLVLLITWLLASSFILSGIALSYLIKKESITLLISTFVLVFLIFFSGFLLPLERMSSLPSAIATYSPGRLALSAFNKAVFYHQGFAAVQNDVLMLSTWVSGLAILALLIKKIRNA